MYLTLKSVVLLLKISIVKFLEYQFMKGFLVQGRQQSFGKFFFLLNILGLERCVPKK